MATLLGFRDRARQTLLRELPEPQAALAVGILLGLQSSIPDDVLDHFSATGTSHILVISGWNITIISAALYSLADGMKLARAQGVLDYPDHRSGCIPCSSAPRRLSFVRR